MEQTERRHGNWKWKQTGNCSQKAAEAAGCEIKRKSYRAQSERDFRIRMQCQFEFRRTKWAQVRSENFNRERQRENVQMSKCKLQVQYFSVLFPFLLWLWLCASSPHVHLCFYATLCQHRTELWNSQQRRVVDTAPLHFVGTLLHHLHQCHPLLDPLLWHSLDPMVRSFFFMKGDYVYVGWGGQKITAIPKWNRRNWI